MAITVTGPLATPVVTLTPAAGGTLTAGTYEVGVACANTSSYSLLVADNRRSAAWIGQVVVAANQQITVSYAAITGATHYNIYIRNVTTGETWYGGNRRHGSADTTATTTATSYVITSLGTRRPHFDTFTYDTTYFTPPITLNTGTIVVHISGTDTSAYYYQNIYDAVNAAGYAAYITLDKGNFWMKGQLIIDSGATGVLAPYAIKQTSDLALNYNIHFMQGIILNNSAGFTVAWGTTQRGAILYQEAWSWNINSQYQDWTECTIMGGNWQQLRAQTYLWGGDHYFIVSNNTISTEGLNLKGVNIQNQKTNGAVTGIKTNGALLIQTANAAYQYCESNGTGTLATFTTGQTATWRDSTISNATFSRHHRPRNLVPGGVYFWNVRWKNNTTSLPTAGGAYLDRPEIYYESGAGGLANTFYQGASFGVKVVDGAGTAIQNATVTLYNESDDSQVFSVTTDTNGDIVSQDVVYESGVYDNSGVYGNGTGTDYSWLHTVWTVRSFRLQVDAIGYTSKIVRGVKFKSAYNTVVNMGVEQPLTGVLLNQIGDNIYHGK